MAHAACPATACTGIPEAIADLRTALQSLESSLYPGGGLICGKGRAFAAASNTSSTVGIHHEQQQHKLLETSYWLVYNTVLILEDALHAHVMGGDPTTTSQAPSPSSGASASSSTPVSGAGAPTSPCAVHDMKGLTDIMHRLLQVLGAEPCPLRPARPLPPPLHATLTSAALGLYARLSETAAIHSTQPAAAVWMEDVSLSAGMAVLLESSMVAGGGMERRALEELTWTLSHQMHNAISQPPGDAATSPAMQLPKRHKKLWWMAYGVAARALQQSLRGLPTAGPGWASNRLVQALAPGVQLEADLCTATDALPVFGNCASILMAGAANLIHPRGKPMADLELELAQFMGAGGSPGQAAADGLLLGALGAPTSAQLAVLQLQAVTEFLIGDCDDLQECDEQNYLALLRFLAVMVAAAEPCVRSAFLSSVHFQQVLVVLQVMAGLSLSPATQDMFRRPTAIMSPAPPPSAAAAQAAGSREVGMSASAVLGPKPSAVELVLGLLKALTMHDPALDGCMPTSSGKQSCRPPAVAVQGLRHLYDAAAPCTSLCWAPGLPLTPPLWGLLERCVRAEGHRGKAAMQLAERWVQLAVKEVTSYTGQAATSTPNSSNSSSRPTSWYGALGSLLVSMAKVRLRSWDDAGIMSTQLLLMQLATQLDQGMRGVHATCAGSRSDQSLRPSQAQVQNRKRPALQAERPPQQQQQQRHQPVSNRPDVLFLLGAMQRAAAALGWWVCAAHTPLPNTSTGSAIASMQRCMEAALGRLAHTCWGRDQVTMSTPADMAGSSQRPHRPEQGMWSAAAASDTSAVRDSKPVASSSNSSVDVRGAAHGAAHTKGAAAAAKQGLSGPRFQAAQQGPAGSSKGSLGPHIKKQMSQQTPRVSGGVQSCRDLTSSQGKTQGSCAAGPPPPVLYTAACAYVPCMNLSGPSEVTLVTNRGGVVCGGCGVVRWCSEACAAKGWSAHRKQCKRLGVARSAGP